MNKRKPTLSIGLPVYNGEPFLQQALQSLLAQTYSDFELIVSDNASTDRTEEICRDYAAKDARVRYSRNTKNIGVGPNFNRVFKLSTGEYFKWASADDVCEPEHLARCLDVLYKDQSAVLACSRARFIDNAGKPLDLNDPGWNLRVESPYDRLRYVIGAGHWVNPHYGVIRSGALAKTRLMPGYPGGDYRLLAELSLLGKFVEIPEYLFMRRVHPGASSQNTTKTTWMIEFHSGKESTVCFPFWHLSVDHLITIIKSKLILGEKASLVAVVLRGMWWQHRRLLEELRFGCAFYWHRLPLSRSRFR